MDKKNLKIVLLLTVLFLNLLSFSQTTERERPKEWSQLVKGGRFMDRFLPMIGKVLSSDTWGADNVKPRFIDNGIEDGIWSYWCSSVKKSDDGKYHMFVCGWLESSPKGHGEWPNSLLFDAVGDKPEGPFTLKKMIGKGHNVEAFRVKDGRYVLYVIDGRYVSDNIDGPWEYGKFQFEPRDRKIIEGLSNLSFAEREDGSFVMVCRGGGIWISKDGLSQYNQLTDKRVYPAVKGRFEDPVIWKDHIQYHMIVNDWLGRIAFYLRSPNGIDWVTDPGEAYMPGIAVHEDGKVEDWFKFERIKMYQDQYGRAVQANFAVIDVEKKLDKANDIHSSKSIAIPLNPGVLLTILDEKPITSKTSTIRLKIQAEPGFNPQTDIDISSLRFGASEEVNYGRGAKVLSTENSGNDLIVIFNGEGNGIGPKEFAPKLIGRYKNEKMLYGYARLPYLTYIEPVLSARAPVFTSAAKDIRGTVEVENFGQVASQKAAIKIEYKAGDKWYQLAYSPIPSLNAYEKTVVPFSGKMNLESDKEYEFILSIYEGKKLHSTFNLKQKIR
ncbi:MAG: glycoside hydrolase family protein [Niabella sp.]